LWIASALITLVWGPLLASAEPAVIPEVTLDINGPNKEVPTDNPFYLKGTTGPDVTAVYATFVRVGFPPWGLGTAMSCSDAEKALSADLLAPSPDGKGFALDSARGVVAIDALWGAPPDGQALTDYKHLLRWHNAYVAQPWKLPPPAAAKPGDAAKPPAEAQTQEQSFSILVSDRTFFRPAATYCLFLYERQALKHSERVTIRRATADAAKAAAACARDDDKCLGKAASGLLDLLERKLKGKIAEQQKILDVVRTRLFANSYKMATFRSGVQNTLSPTSAPHYYTEPWQPSKDFLPVDTHPLARLILEALAPKSVLRQGSPVGYFTRDGKTPIRYLRIYPDLSQIDVASSNTPAAGEVVAIPLNAGEITIHDTVTLEELIRFAGGKVRAPQAFTRLRDELLPKVLKPSIDAIEAAQAKGDELPAETLGELKSQLDRLHDAVKSTCSLRKQYSSVDQAVGRPLGTTLEALAGQWLAMPEALGPADDQSCSPAQLKALLNDVANMKAAMDAWRGAQSRIEASWEEIRIQSPIHAVRVGMRLTRESFTTQYISPFVGHAVAIKPGDDLGMNYFGIHVTLYPNSVDEPMWTNGRGDIRRLPSLEIGMSLESPLGASGRFKGPGKFNPLFFGLALQPLPYLTTSVGACLMERRTSTITQEVTQFYGSFYVGFSAELNFLDGVRKLAVGPAATFVQAAKN
jgi:hypothetical protein